MEQLTIVGIDLAKHIFSLHGVDAAGRLVFRKTVRRDQLDALVAQLPACLIGMEACSGAHAWARRFPHYGHRIKLMAPKFVAAYRTGSKNDGNDAAAICEAASRTQVRAIPVKSAEQQAVLCLHRARQGFVEKRTATINRIRGLLAEFGIVLAQRAQTVRTQLETAIEALPRWPARCCAICVPMFA
jgi:transposase